MNFIKKLLVVSMVVLFAMPMPSFAMFVDTGSGLMFLPDSSGRRCTCNDEPPAPPRWRTHECTKGFHKVDNYCVLDQ